MERRLAAILAADVASYSRLMGADEEGTLAALKAIRREVVDPIIGEHRGRIVKTTGDGMLVEFASVVDAVRCAVEVQREMHGRNTGVSAERRIEFRIGINLGDIIIDDGDIFGDGVNVAARLETLAEPGGICVSRVVRDQVRDKLDFSFGDMGEQQVKNILRPVRVHRVDLGGGMPPSDRLAEAETQSQLALPDKPSIAVLPFQNMSGDPEQEYFVDGMVEEIITALSRVQWLFVIARNSTFTYKGRAVDVRQVGRELGVRYVLEGSVRRAGTQVRITGQLIDALTGTHLWAERFDGSLEDVFELQDKVATHVAGLIEPALQAAEIRRSIARPTADLSAYDLYLRALASFFPITKDRIVESLRLLDQAIALDRHYGQALSWAAICHMHIARNSWAEASQTQSAKDVEFARKALLVGENDPAVLANAAYVLSHYDEDISTTIALVDRALLLNPSFARGWHLSGQIRLLAGQYDQAIEHVGMSLRLSPRERTGNPQSVMGRAYFFKHQFDEAAAKLLLAIQENPGLPVPYRFLAACYSHMGRLDEARAIIVQLRVLTSLIVPHSVDYRIPEDRELFLSGLRLAAGDMT